MSPILLRCLHTAEEHPAMLLLVGMLAAWALFNASGSVPSSEAEWVSAMHRVYSQSAQPLSCAPATTPPTK